MWTISFLWGELRMMQSQVQKLFEEMGMAINCTKSNVLYCKDALLKLGTFLLSSDGDMLGDIKWAQSTHIWG